MLNFVLSKIFPPTLGKLDDDFLARLPNDENNPPYPYEGCYNLREWANGRWNRKKLKGKKTDEETLQDFRFVIGCR